MSRVQNIGATIYQRAATILAVAAMVVASVVISGWLLDVDTLQSVFPGLATMKFNTALCFLLCGASLYFRRENRRTAHTAARRVSMACAAAVLALALLTLLEYGLSINLGIDELILQDPDTPRSAWPGRMSVATAVDFTLLALSLLLLDVNFLFVRRGAALLALLTTFIGGAALLGYLYGVKAFQFAVFSSMALHTALLFVLLGLGILLARPGQSLMTVVADDRLGGRLLRVGIPAVVLIPITIGWLSIEGLVAGIYSIEFGFALNTLSSIAALVLLIWVVAKSLGKLQKRIEEAHRQQSFLASIVESSEDAIVSKDLDGLITSWNAAAERTYGYSEAEMLGQPMSLLLPEDRRNEEAEILSNIKQGRRIDHIESIRKHKGGRFLDMSITISPITDEQGNVVGASNVARDISERKRAQQRIAAVVEAAPSAMIMVDRNGVMVLVNTQTEIMFGRPRAQLIGSNIEMLLPERYRQDHQRMFAEFFKQPEARAMGVGRDLHGLHADLREFSVEVGLSPIEILEGDYVLAAVVDITQRKEAEQALQIKTEELLRSNRDLEQYAYIASHDLQEPLRAVSGCIQLLEQRHQAQLSDSARELMHHAIDGSKRMQTLIGDLLLYSRIGKSEENFRKVDCNKAVDFAVKNLSQAIEESAAMLNCAPLPTVFGIASQLTLLFQNLIGNAIKFRRADVPIRIDVEAIRQENVWLFSIKDNGIGVESQYFERIFTIFQRLHTRREYPGTGMGLALCKRIVEYHGGRIWIESILGSGTTVFFTLSRQ